MIRVNMNQMSKWIVTQDNVKFYNHIMRCKGSVMSLDYRPYVELLSDFGIFFTAQEA